MSSSPFLKRDFTLRPSRDELPRSLWQVESPQMRLQLDPHFRTINRHDKSPNTSPNTLAGQSLGLGGWNR